MSEKVTVLITASQTVSYRQEVEMDRDEFERLDKMLDSAEGASARQAVFDVIESFINTHDVYGAEDIEIEEFHKCDEVAE